jgi:segregation and condensation protein B
MNDEELQQQTNETDQPPLQADEEKNPELTLVPDEQADQQEYESTDDSDSTAEVDTSASVQADPDADETDDQDIADDQPADEDTDTGERSDESAALQSISTEQVVEALLFASDSPLTLQKIVSIVGVGSARDMRKHIESLNERYQQQGNSFRIDSIAGGYKMMTLPDYNTWIRKLKKNRQESKLSQAAMETLAVVAYKQPVVRAEIEAIRGVAAGEMLNRLREMGLVKIVGRAEDVGRPMLYGTTRRFLEVFGLASLDDLPQVEELQPPAG